MRARVVKIGNSQGIRIPKPILDQTGIRDGVELLVENSQIIIRPIDQSRAGWDHEFKAMAQKGHDALLDGDDVIATEWDDSEWKW